MQKLRNLFRIIKINTVLIKNRLDEIVLSIPVFAPIRFFAYLNPCNWRRKNKKSRGERLREAFVELGPIFVKFGQMLSTRGDILPDDIIVELEKLQDQVSPFPGVLAKQIIEKSLGKSITELFESFELEALASASIAQVHAAKLYDGKSVVVKVLRPNIKNIITSDTDLLLILARLMKRYSKEAARLRPVEVVHEFKRVLLHELDLQREAANAAQLKRNFENSDLLYIPEVYWSMISDQVMVMERVFGIPISDIDRLTHAGVNLQQLAERGVTIFYTQVFQHGFFHADMHPGNIFVDPSDPLEPRYIAVDFGIVGVLSPSDQRYLAENMVAFFRRDYRRVAELHIESNWVPANTNVEEFESAIRTVSEPIFQKPLKEISFGRVLMRLFETGRQFHMEVQPQLVLLQKTLLQIEGLGRMLYPDLDLWQTGKPLLEKWIKKQMGFSVFAKNIREKLPEWAEKLPEMPDLIYDVLNKLQHASQKPVVPNIVKTVKSGRQNILVGFGSALILVTLLNVVFIQFNFSDGLNYFSILGLIGFFILVINLFI